MITTIHPTVHIILQLHTTLIHHIHQFQSKFLKTTHNITKSDKYFRLVSNSVKYLRAISDQNKKKYSKVYKQLLIVRQIIRWNNIYTVGKEMYQLGWSNFGAQHVSTFLHGLLEIFGDLLDRCIFVLELLNLKQYQGRLSKIEQLQSDCYFIQCTIWLFFHIRTFMKVWRKGDKQQRRNKVLKIAKYILDCLTSYTKFSKRIWQLNQKHAAILGIISSLIGIYDILK